MNPELPPCDRIKGLPCPYPVCPVRAGTTTATCLDAARVGCLRRFADEAAAEAYLATLDAGDGPAATPGLLAMAGNLASAVVDHARGGFRAASDEAQATRRATCDACPSRDPETDRCGPCGCFLSAKIAWASSSCPESPPRWGPEAG